MLLLLLEGAVRLNRFTDVLLLHLVPVLIGASLCVVLNHRLRCSSTREKLGPLWLWVEDEPHEFSSACFPACVASLCVADGICGPVQTGDLEAGSHAEEPWMEVNSTLRYVWRIATRLAEKCRRQGGKALAGNLGAGMCPGQAPNGPAAGMLLEEPGVQVLGGLKSKTETRHAGFKAVPVVRR